MTIDEHSEEEDFLKTPDEMRIMSFRVCLAVALGCLFLLAVFLWRLLS